MKIKFTIRSLPRLLSRHINYVMVVIVVFIGLWLVIFSYRNVYQTVINPPPIDENTIIATRQKVDLVLFETTIDNINKKKQSAENVLNFEVDLFK